MDCTHSEVVALVSVCSIVRRGAGRVGGTLHKMEEAKIFFFKNAKSLKSHQRKFTGIFFFRERNAVRRVEIFLAWRSRSVSRATPPHN